MIQYNYDAEEESTGEVSLRTGLLEGVSTGKVSLYTLSVGCGVAGEASIGEASTGEASTGAGV